MIKNIEIVKTKPVETELEKAILRVFNGISTKMNEIIDAVNEIALWKECTAELLAKHDVFGEKQPARFTPEMMSEIRQKMKIPVVTDESAQNLLSENIELKAENVRLVQDLNRVCDQKFEELDASVRQSNKDLFAENQKLKSALDWCIKTFKSLEQVLDEKASASDIPDNPDLYAWAVRIKPIWGELKEITGIDYKGGDNE